MSAGPDLAIVITTYDVRELLVRCLDALKAAAGSLSIEVVVVDNGFRDDSWQTLLDRGDVRAVRGSTDLGFGAANNIGAQLTQAPMILFLNPDTEPEPGSIKLLAEALICRSDVAVVGPILYLDDGDLDPAARRNFPNPINAMHRFLGASRALGKLVARPYNEPVVEGREVDVVDAVSGACLLVRREAFLEIGGFDPRYFMYGDDLDLQRRLVDCGWKALFVPSARVRHRKRKSSQQRLVRTRFEFYRSMWIYYHAHHGADPAFLKASVSVGIILFGAAAVFRRMLPRRLGF